MLKHSHVKTDFVGPCAHLSGVGHQVLVTCRTCGGHRENLVGYILVGYGVFKANTVVDARQVELPVLFSILHVFGGCFMYFPIEIVGVVVNEVAVGQLTGIKWPNQCR